MLLSICCQSAYLCLPFLIQAKGHGVKTKVGRRRFSAGLQASTSSCFSDPALLTVHCKLPDDTSVPLPAPSWLEELEGLMGWLTEITEKPPVFLGQQKESEPRRESFIPQPAMANSYPGVHWRHLIHKWSSDSHPSPLVPDQPFLCPLLCLLP